jgi:hypothetical protein
MQRTLNLLTGGLAAAAAAAALIAAPAQASTPNSCTYDAGTKIASYHLEPGGGGVMEIELEGDTLVFFDAYGKGYCTSPVTGKVARRSDTASILFTGTAGKDDFIVSEQGGTFAGGAAEGTDSQQIEITVLSDAQDTVDVVATNAPDYVTITGGDGTGTRGAVSLNPFNAKPGIKMTFDPAVVRVNGMGGSDNLLGRSYKGATSMHLDLSGGDGNDAFTDGLLAGDHLQGNAGDDSFNTKDGQPGDNITGGTGIDGAAIDPIDQAFEVEKLSAK